MTLSYGGFRTHGSRICRQRCETAPSVNARPRKPPEPGRALGWGLRVSGRSARAGWEPLEPGWSPWSLAGAPGWPRGDGPAGSWGLGGVPGPETGPALPTGPETGRDRARGSGARLRGPARLACPGRVQEVRSSSTKATLSKGKDGISLGDFASWCNPSDHIAGFAWGWGERSG